MREIKFRAWDNYKKRMFEVKGLRQTPIGTWQIWDGEILIEPVVITLMQYTGLKDKNRFDKNGKEIYEGDIAKIDECPFLRIVKIPNIHKWNYRKIKIIGNIYENPELME